DKNVAWKNPGGDWYDKNGVSQGDTPYASITLKGSELPDNKYYELDVTELVKEYVSGKYENTGVLIKARTENNNYIAFYSIECGIETQKPKLQLEYLI
ncbi:MAG: disaggregatase related repeat-containing protein, partial [Methanosarcina sp.]